MVLHGLRAANFLGYLGKFPTSNISILITQRAIKENIFFFRYYMDTDFSVIWCLFFHIGVKNFQFIILSIRYRCHVSNKRSPLLTPKKSAPGKISQLDSHLPFPRHTYLSESPPSGLYTTQMVMVSSLCGIFVG